MQPKAAFLWDESFLWGIMAYDALKTCSLSFDLIRADSIKKGRLSDYKMLFVPGGWASNKLKSLGEKGIDEIKEFVKNGGNYAGFCGGAGLATLEGIGLLNVSRKPSKERVPSFSGRINLNINGHPIWKGVSDNSQFKVQDSRQNSSLPFHAWWPSQFLIPPLGSEGGLKTIATFGNALPDSFISDLNVGDTSAAGRWKDFEDIYQINLNPVRLINEPAVVEGNYGKGTVLLSLVHFDTPDDKNGAEVLRNIWEYLSGQDSEAIDVKEKGMRLLPRAPQTPESRLIYELESAVERLISLGIRNFLWFWRSSMLLQWRRGVRGLEYCTLHVMIKKIAEIMRSSSPASEGMAGDLNRLKELLLPFIEKAERLLILERHAMQDNHITYDRCDNEEIQDIRKRLFSTSKSHGGMFKELISEIDNFLYSLLTMK